MDAQVARVNAKMTVEEASRRARISAAYLRRIERGVGAPYALALRLSHIYATPMDRFLRTRKGGKQI